MDHTIGFIKVYNFEDIFEAESFYETEKNFFQKILTNTIIDFIEYDFNTNTVSDLLDFLEFSDYSTLYFIINKKSKRFKKIIEYLNTELDTKIIILENNSSYKIENQEIDIQLDYISNINLSKMLKTSYYIMHSGFYPYPEKIHLKHIVIDNIEDVESIDVSLFLNSSINSVIFYEYGFIERVHNNSNVFPLILKKEVLNKNSDIIFSNVSKDKLKNEIEIFIQKGIINNDNIHINDIGRYRKGMNLNALFIQKGKIYADINHNAIISNDITINVFELLNSLKQIDMSMDFPKELYAQYHLCKILAEANNISRFITYLNHYKLPGIENVLRAKFTGWIAFIEPDGIYLFDSLKNKAYEINEMVLEIFEYLTKDKEELLKTKVDKSLIEDVKRMLS